MGIFDRFKSKKQGRNTDLVTESSKEPQNELVNLIVTAWKDGNAEILRPVLSEDFMYTSVAVSKPMSGAETYLNYLAGKFQTFRNNSVSFDPEIIDEETPDSKIIILNDNSSNPPVLLCHFNDKKIDAIMMRPATMLKMQDLNDPDKFDVIVNKACSAIHGWVESEVKRLGYGEYDFTWIQKYPIFDAPAFQHICFRLGKSVFSVVINLYGQFHTDESGAMAILPNVQLENQSRECSNNDLIACNIYLDINALATPTLCYSGEDRMVDMKGDAEKGSGIMSEWEINAMAINIVLDQITKDALDYLSYTNVLTFFPQIFYKKNGQKYFVYVDGHPAGIDVRQLNIDQIENVSKNGWIGKFADVGMSILEGNNGEFKDTILFRTNSICSNFRELKSIEDAISLYGTCNGGCYPIE